MAKRHSKEGGNHLEQESNRQKTMEGIDGGLHPAVDGRLHSVVDGQSQVEKVNIIDDDDDDDDDCGGRYRQSSSPDNR